MSHYFAQMLTVGPVYLSTTGYSDEKVAISQIPFLILMWDCVQVSHYYLIYWMCLLYGMQLLYLHIWYSMTANKLKVSLIFLQEISACYGTWWTHWNSFRAAATWIVNISSEYNHVKKQMQISICVCQIILICIIIMCIYFLGGIICC